MAGMSPSGFEFATQAQLLTEIQQAMRTSPALNPNGRVNLAPDSVLGVLSAIVADKLAELWQLMQAVYSSQYRSGAEGASLDALADLVMRQHFSGHKHASQPAVAFVIPHARVSNGSPSTTSSSRAGSSPSKLRPT